MGPRIDNSEPLSSIMIQSERYEQARKIVRSLRDSGAESLLPLPRIMVAGQQSAGKSSMLEVLSGIKFPQGSGTCTRYCTELRLTKSDIPNTFKGSVEFRTGKITGEADSKRWNENPLNLPIPESIISMEEVTGVLRDASRRLLGDDHDGFSDSVLVLTIESDLVETLDVIDTPGIVEAGENEKEMEWLRKMVSGYMKQENTIILATVECAGDLKNQRFLEMVKAADPTQQRTKLILTKVDRIEEQDEERWVEIVRGEGDWAAYSRVHGVHAVSCRTPTELKNGTDEAERQSREREEFKKQKWRFVNDNNLGSWNLKSEINRLLDDLVERTLPTIMEKAVTDLTQVTADLRGLPNPIAETQEGQVIALTNLVMRFVEESSKMMELSSAVGNRFEMFGRYKAANEALREALRKTQPLTARPPTTEKPNEPVVTEPGVKCGQTGIFSFASPTTSRFGSSSASPFGAIREPPSFASSNGFMADANSSEFPSPISESSRSREEKAEIHGESSVHNPKSKEYFAKVRKLVHDLRARELPDIVPAFAREELIKEIVGQWREPAEKYLVEVHKLIQNGLHELVKIIAPNLPNLRSTLWDMTDSLLESQREIASDRLVDILEAELYPFTMNEHYLRDLKVRESRILEKNTISDAKIMAAFHKLNLPIEVSSFADLEKKRPELVEMLRHSVKTAQSEDDTGEIIDLVASVRGYVKVAYKRVADYVPMMVDQALMRRFHNQIKHRFVGEIMNKPANEKHALLCETRKVRERRKELLEKQGILKNAVDQLRPLCKMYAVLQLYC
eukprot:996455_1